MLSYVNWPFQFLFFVFSTLFGCDIQTGGEGGGTSEGGGHYGIISATDQRSCGYVGLGSAQLFIMSCFSFLYYCAYCFLWMYICSDH